MLEEREREEISEMGWRVEGSGGFRVPENGVWVLGNEEDKNASEGEEEDKREERGVYLSTEPVF